MEQFEIPRNFDDNEDDSISLEAKAASDEYEQRRTMVEKIYDLAKAKEVKERAELNWINKYLKEVKNYGEKTALKITVRIGELKSYSLEVISEFKDRLDNFIYGDI